MPKPNLLWGAMLIVWMIVIWWLSDQPDLRSGLANDFLWRKLAHVGEFAVLFLLWVKTISGRAVTRPLLLVAFVLTANYAMLDEWHQTWVAGRHGTVADVGIDMIGAGALAVLLGWRTKRLSWPRGGSFS